MADNKKYLLDGYRFETEAGLETAKKELSKINQVKQVYDLRNPDELRKAYDLLIDSSVFETPVGIGFLREMQKVLARDPESRKSLRAIPAPRGATEDLYKFQSEILAKNTLVEYYNERIKNLHIIVGFMVALVVALFLYTVLDRHLAPVLIKDQVTNVYSTWQEQMDETRDKLYEKAEELKKKYPDASSEIDNIMKDLGEGTESSEAEDGKIKDTGS